MTGNTLDDTYADQGSVLRPSLMAVVMIVAGLGLLFLDNDRGSGGNPLPLVVVSQVR